MSPDAGFGGGGSGRKRMTKAQLPKRRKRMTQAQLPKRKKHHISTGSMGSTIAHPNEGGGGGGGSAAPVASTVASNAPPNRMDIPSIASPGLPPNRETGTPMIDGGSPPNRMVVVTADSGGTPPNREAAIAAATPAATPPNRMVTVVTQIEQRVSSLETVEKLYIPAWDDYVIQIGQSKLPTSAAPSVVDWRGSQVLSFSKSATNSMFFAAQMPHAYKEGSDIEFHIHVAYPAALTGNSRWQVTYPGANIGEDFGGETTVAATAASPNVINRHALIEIAGTITGTGKLLSSMILGSISRLGGDGADTYDGEIYLIGADFHVLRDALGSRAAATK